VMVAGVQTCARPILYVTGASAGTAIVTYTLPTGCYVTRGITVNSSPGTITGSLKVCVGSSTTLGITGSGGSWGSSVPATGSIDAVGVVTGRAPGNTTITYSAGTGCATTAVVTVHALPAPFIV